MLGSGWGLGERCKSARAERCAARFEWAGEMGRALPGARTDAGLNEGGA